MHDKTGSRVPEQLQSRGKPVTPSQYELWQRITRLTFPSREKGGSILDVVCASVLDHRTSEADGWPCNRGVRKAKVRVRHRGFMIVTEPQLLISRNATINQAPKFTTTRTPPPPRLRTCIISIIHIPWLRLGWRLTRSTLTRSRCESQ
jgi:hypothetical protein